jgi:hypothetical protein
MYTYILFNMCECIYGHEARLDYPTTREEGGQGGTEGG